MSNRRVMIVEDDEEIRLALSEILEDNGFDVAAASNGRVALEQLSAGSRLPDLILLDLMMPVMDGRTFRQHQLAHPELARIPTVVISAFRDAHETADGLSAAGLVRKPIDVAVLLETIAKTTAAAR